MPSFPLFFLFHLKMSRHQYLSSLQGCQLKGHPFTFPPLVTISTIYFSNKYFNLFFPISLLTILSSTSCLKSSVSCNIHIYVLNQNASHNHCSITAKNCRQLIASSFTQHPTLTHFFISSKYCLWNSQIVRCCIYKYSFGLPIL